MSVSLLDCTLLKTADGPVVMRKPGRTALTFGAMHTASRPARLELSIFAMYGQRKAKRGIFSIRVALPEAFQPPVL